MSRYRKFQAAVLSLGILFLPFSALAKPADDAISALKAQMNAWNNQDLEGALSYYWASGQMTWVNRKGISFGIAEFAKAMRSDFADKSKMGHYDGKILHSEELSPELVLIVLDWRIVNGEGKKLMGGISSQLWRKTPAGWKAVFEHAS